MAVKVIKHGKRPEDDTMTGSCCRCRCVIECLRSDTEMHSDQREGDSYSVKCPDCGFPIDVDKK